MTFEKPLRPDEVTPPPVSETAPHLAGSTPAEEQWRPVTAAELSASHDYEPTSEDKWPGEWHAMVWAFASGASQRDIARELHYTESRVSIILNKPAVMAKIAEVRKQHGGEALERKFQRMASPAAELMAKVISGEGPGRDAKLSERLDASKWALEKVTGKPRQAGDNDAGTTVLNILQALDSLKSAASQPQASAEVRDVLEIAAGRAEERDWMDDFAEATAQGPATDGKRTGQGEHK